LRISCLIGKESVLFFDEGIEEGNREEKSHAWFIKPNEGHKKPPQTTFLNFQRA
jgi:hypothetical protein